MCREHNPHESREAVSGGVGVLANKPFPIQAAPIKGVTDEVTAARQRLYRSRRWAHAMVGTGNGKLVIHVMSLYGISGSSIPAPRYPRHKAAGKGTGTPHKLAAMAARSSNITGVVQPTVASVATMLLKGTGDSKTSKGKSHSRVKERQIPLSF